MRCCNNAASQGQQKALEVKRSYAVKWCGWRGSNSHGTLCLIERRPTSLTGWRVCHFQRPCSNRAAGWVKLNRVAYIHTMTVTESSCRMTSTVSARFRKQNTDAPFRGLSAKRQTSPMELAGERSADNSPFSWSHLFNTAKLIAAWFLCRELRPTFSGIARLKQSHNVRSVRTGVEKRGVTISESGLRETDCSPVVNPQHLDVAETSAPERDEG